MTHFIGIIILIVMNITYLLLPSLLYLDARHRLYPQEVACHPGEARRYAPLAGLQGPEAGHSHLLVLPGLGEEEEWTS